MVSNAENWIRWGKKAIHESDVREHAGETGRIIPVEQWEQKPDSHELGGEQMETLNQVSKQLPFLSFPQTASTTLTILVFACQHFNGPGGQVRPSLSPKAKDLPSSSLTQPPDWHDHWSSQTGERRPLWWLLSFHSALQAGYQTREKKKWRVNEPIEITLPGVGGGVKAAHK